MNSRVAGVARNLSGQEALGRAPESEGQENQNTSYLVGSSLKLFPIHSVGRYALVTRVFWRRQLLFFAESSVIVAEPNWI